MYTILYLQKKLFINLSRNRIHLCQSILLVLEKCPCFIKLCFTTCTCIYLNANILSCSAMLYVGHIKQDEILHSKVMLC